MGKFNTYRYLVLEDAEDLRGGVRRRQRPVKRFQRLFVWFIFISIILLIGFYSRVFHRLLDFAASKLGFTDTMYTVIIDSTESTTELFVYKFHKYLFGNRLCLDDEVNVKSRPGLISGAYDVNKNDQLHNLLKQACNMIPFEKSLVTPLVFRATSLPSSLPALRIYQINNVVNEFYNYVSSIGSPFYMKPDYFGILRKPEEVVDKWISVDYLLDNGRKLSILDMDDDFLHVVAQLDGNHTTIQPTQYGNIPLFAKSFPNLGLMRARLNVLLMENSEDSVHLNSSCINPIIKDQVWNYDQREYFVSGPTNPQYLNIKETWISVPSRVPIVNASICMNLVKNYVYKNVESHGVPTLPKEHNLFFFGHFFSHASDIGLIDGLKGGKVSMNTLLKVIPTECNFPNVDQPWVCFDLIYIYVLLQRLLGNDAQYQLSTILNDHKVSWAMGSAYTTLFNIIETNL